MDNHKRPRAHEYKNIFGDMCNVAMLCSLTLNYEAIYITQVQLPLRIQVEGKTNYSRMCKLCFYKIRLFFFPFTYKRRLAFKLAMFNSKCFSGPLPHLGEM